MNKIETEAWVLNDGDKEANWESLFKKEVISFDPISEDEVLIEPIFGGWEANMAHALNRNPMDVCKKRRESKVVLGNSGVVRILKIGRNVARVKEGDICALLALGSCNRLGYQETATFGFGYDERGSIGLLARQTKVKETQVFPIPENSTLPLSAWPVISVRYSTAWSNWKLTSNCWWGQVSKEEYPSPYVFGWGGGVVLGELLLAKEQNFKAAMITSSDERIEYIKGLGIIPVDRRKFPGLNYEPDKFESDRDFRKKYYASLNTLRRIVNDITGGEGVSIFIDNIGLPVYSATLRVLARPGIITTSGWKHGMNLDVNRALECHCQHIHVFTHAFKSSECEECIKYAAENNWIPPNNSPVYDWEDIPRLAHDYANGKISSYFPVYRVNPI